MKEFRVPSEFPPITSMDTSFFFLLKSQTAFRINLFSFQYPIRFDFSDIHEELLKPLDSPHNTNSYDDQL